MITKSKSYKQLLGLLFLALFVGSLFTFLTYDAAMAVHNCSSDHCSICENLDRINTWTRQLTTAGAPAVVAFALILLNKYIDLSVYTCFITTTLVTLKVQLNN